MYMGPPVPPPVPKSIDIYCKDIGSMLFSCSGFRYCVTVYQIPRPCDQVQLCVVTDESAKKYNGIKLTFIPRHADGTSQLI